MIIWGSYVMNKELKTGEFYCPHCSNPRSFIHKLPRRWGHLYWIPLIPMDKYDSYIECQTCKKTYNEQVLDHDPRRDKAAAETNLSALIGQIMIHVAHAQKTELSAPSITMTIKDVLGLETLSPQAEETYAVPMDKNAMLDLVREHAGLLTAKGQEIVLVKSVGAIPLTPEVGRLVGEIGAAMGMTASHVNGVLADLAQNPAAPHLVEPALVPSQEQRATSA
ncbi:hypothetical protein [Methylobacterium brachythecii]|uniref:Zinc-ribbon 15 domain-containing protein n=1 Tax=Methylobacterium brachythecii TaxID=1176177 RepID=A0A7W6AI99_9HYPH|nr:hypothetical protein [Methylobacterium brachythecii]MBB3901456.1 hypothetical protein [Methylobacterium brachythecii]GLS43028.1 hypothetical protein GCM10007884_10130 [Methylobacterium brachythecii]